MAPFKSHPLNFFPLFSNTFPRKIFIHIFVCLTAQFPPTAEQWKMAFSLRRLWGAFTAEWKCQWKKAPEKEVGSRRGGGAKFPWKLPLPPPFFPPLTRTSLSPNWNLFLFLHSLQFSPHWLPHWHARARIFFRAAQTQNIENEQKNWKGALKGKWMKNGALGVGWANWPQLEIRMENC